MKHKHKLSELDLHVLNTKNPENHQVELVENAFQFWRKSWQETFKSLNVASGNHLYADDFLDREVMGLFDGTKPVALFFNSAYAMRPSHLAHSYFHNYPREVIQKIQELNIDRFMTLSYMTCDPNYRKSHTDIPMSELLFSIGVLKFQSMPHEFLIGYIRKDLSFYKVFENHGGTLLHTTKAYNVDVDFLVMTKQTMKLSSVPGVAETAKKLWEKSIAPQRILKVA